MVSVQLETSEGEPQRAAEKVVLHGRVTVWADAAPRRRQKRNARGVMLEGKETSHCHID
jgi:hypothetical protein